MSMFSDDVQNEILRVVRDVRRTAPGAATSPYTRSAGLSVYLAKTSTSGIAAMSTSDVPGSGTVSLYHITTAGLVAAPGSPSVTAHNIARNLVAASVFVQLKQELISGKYIIDFEDCS